MTPTGKSRSLFGPACRVMALVAVFAAAVAATPAAAQDFDTLSTQLKSPDWGVRYGAVIELDKLPVSSLPDGIRTQLIGLLQSEALAPDKGPPPGEGEEYGEYVIDLSLLVVKLDDPRAIRAVALLGIQMSLDAQEFLAKQGPAALPALDESWEGSETSRTSIMNTWGFLVTAAPGNGMTKTDVAGILRRMLAGADSAQVGFSAAAVDDAALVEAVPIMQHFLKADSTDQVERVWIHQLEATRDSMPPGQLAARLRLWTTGICQGATGARLGACESVDNLLEDAEKQIAANRRNPARQALAALAKRAKAAEQVGAFSANETVLITENARYLESRL